MNHIMNQNEEKNDPGTLIKQIASHWSSCLADRLDVDPSVFGLLTGILSGPT